MISFQACLGTRAASYIHREIKQDLLCWPLILLVLPYSSDITFKSWEAPKLADLHCDEIDLITASEGFEMLWGIAATIMNQLSNY